MTTRRKFTCAFVGVSLSAPWRGSAQQTRPDFSGTWELDLDRVEGPFTPPAMTQVIEQKDPVFKWTTQIRQDGVKVPMFLTGFAAPNGETKTDGHYETVKIQGGERETHALWSGQKLVTSWAIRTLHDPSDGKWTRSLSEDGKTQTVELQFRSAMMGLVQATLVFVRRA